MRDVEPQRGTERIFLVFRTEHALRHVAAAARLCAGIPTRPPLHRQIQHEGNNRQRPNRIRGPAQVKRRKEREHRTRGLAALSHRVVNVRQLNLQQCHSADLCDRNPREHDDHGHLQDELE